MKKLILFFAVRIFGCSFISVAQLTHEINPDLLTKIWPALWIKHPATNDQYGVYHFRKSFELGNVPGKFIIHISADNRYWLYVNGKRICTGPAKGDLGHWRFESLDIASYLQKGKNVLAVTVYNPGDYRATWQVTGGTGLVVQGNTATEALVNTDTSWKVMENTAYSPLFEIHKLWEPARVFWQPGIHSTGKNRMLTKSFLHRQFFPKKQFLRECTGLIPAG
ncbi:MAG: hypothetical protein HC830_05310 [Bacteroidetes bacterium]|nr:hypothetical protein [Bacteroidota bacterium]